MNKKLEQLLDSNDMTNLKLALVINNNVEEIADYMIMKSHEALISKIETLSNNPYEITAYYGLIDSRKSADDYKYTLYDKMYEISEKIEDYNQLFDWSTKEEIRPVLIDYLNKLNGEY